MMRNSSHLYENLQHLVKCINTLIVAERRRLNWRERSFLQDLKTAIAPHCSTSSIYPFVVRAVPVFPRSTAFLEYINFEPSESKDNDDHHCAICYVEFENGEHIVKTSCCRTKRMHMNCAMGSLRRRDACPFCNHSRIAFQDLTNRVSNTLPN